MLLAPVLWGQQPITFDSVRFNPANSYLIGFSAFERDSGYQVFAIAGDGTGAAQGLRSISFSPNGSFELERQFHRPRLQWIGNTGPVTRVSEGGFATGVGVFGGGVVIDSLYLYRFDEFGDTLWTRFLYADTTTAIRKCIQASNGDFILVGLNEWPKGAFIFRTTSLGDSIRYVNLGSPALFAESIAESDNGDLFIAGHGENADPNFNDNCQIVKCTPEGEVIWRRTRSRISAYHHVIATQDGGVLAMGFYRPYPNWTPQNYNGPSISFAVKYDADGNELWQRDLAASDNNVDLGELTDGYENEDGSMIVCGTAMYYYAWNKGLLYKLSANGEVIWDRNYSHYDSVPGSNAQIFNAVQPTRDGGYILTGEANGPSPPNPQRLWLMKLDSMGCLVPGCNTVGVQEFESQLQSALRLSPNPASDQLHVELPLPDGYRLVGAVQAVLLDAQGKEVLRNTIGNTGIGLNGNLDVSGLPSGMYFLHLRDGEKWLAGGKVVVE